MKIPYFVVFFFLFIAILRAQDDDLFLNNIKFKSYSTKEGLSQRSVTCILQDKQGFIWLGTRYGLNKFDGKIFEKYYYNSENPNSISNNWITKIIEDQDGTIWIGTKKGLNKYNTNDNNFIRVKKTNQTKQFYNNEIWDIKVQDPHFLWIATNNGLDKFNTTTNNVLTFKHHSKNTKSISANKVREILITSNNNLWVNTSEKIDVYNPKKNSFKHIDYPHNASPALTKSNNTTLFQDTSKNIWLGYDKGLAIFNSKDNVFEDFKLNAKTIITNSVRSICEDKDKNIWVGTYRGLYKIDLKNNTLYKYEHDITNPQSLSQNSVYKILEDTRGDLWIGTWGGGVNYYDKSSSDFTTFSEGYSNKNLNYNVVSSIVEDSNENLWIGTEGGGINFYDKKRRIFTYFKHESENLNSLSDNNIKAIIKDHKNNFWVGTHAGGLNQIIIDKKSKTFLRYKNNPTDSTSISDNKITTLAEDTHFNIWIGTNKGGLNCYLRKTKSFIRIDDPNNYLGNFIYKILVSNTNNILFIGSENGLAQVDINTHKITKINFRGQTKSTFTLNPVTNIFQESPYKLWIGTEGDGLYNYNTSTKTSVRYGLHNKLPDDVIYGILPEKNNIWISTNRGLSRINLISKKIKNFDETSGIQGNEFNYGAYLKTKKGLLLFGGSDGFTVFNPTKIKKDTFTPPISITSFKVRNKPYKIIPQSLKTITLNYNQNDFSFNFSALGYAHPNKNQYAYKLEGFDTDWVFNGNNNTAVYTNLNPGNYTFKVKASNNDGVWNKEVPSISLSITPPLWKTWWAFLSYLLLSITLFWLIRKYTLLRIHDRNELKKERLDKKQIEEVNRLKLLLFTNISHDFRTPLTLIIGPLKKMIQEKSGNEYVQKQHSGMYRNASILLQLINQLLDFRKSEAGKLHIHASKNNIVSFIQNVQLLFSELAKDQNITYTIESSEKLIEVWFDKIEIKKVLLNVLSNAFKFTPKNGAISIKISTQTSSKNTPFNNAVKIEISDSGKGISKENLKLVFDRYFQLGQENELRSGTGVGLALAKDIVDLHKGKIYAQNNLNKGSCFTILLPLGNSHLSPQEITKNTNPENNLFNYDEIVTIQPNWIKNNTSNPIIEFNNKLPSILLVEDNIEVRQFIKEIFKTHFNIFEAENGEIGINKAQHNPIDIIISDIMMPEMNGIELCTRIKSDIRTSHIPVILLTARTSSHILKEGYETGADVYLTKPFNSETLRLQVLNILKSRKSLITKFKKDILLEPKEITFESTDEIFLQKAMKIIEKNLSNSNFNVNSFTDKIHMSQSVLYRKIKVLTGQSISEFIRTIRLKRASQLLSETNMSIPDIAYNIGFNDLKYFRSCFKRTFNKTPLQYRKSNHSKR